MISFKKGKQTNKQDTWIERRCHKTISKLKRDFIELSKRIEEKLKYCKDESYMLSEKKKQNYGQSWKYKRSIKKRTEIITQNETNRKFKIILENICI